MTMDNQINRDENDLLKKHKNVAFISFISLLLLYLCFSYGVSLFAFISPSRDLRWDGNIYSINSLQFHRGDTVFITGFLEQASLVIEAGEYYTFTNPENIVWSVTVMDPDDLAVYHYTIAMNSVEGDITLEQKSFVLSSDASYGLYKVRILAWTNWLPDGETRTNAIEEGTFEVIP